MAVKIVVSKDGNPYMVTGGPDEFVCRQLFRNKEGMSWDWKTGEPIEAGKTYALCRCGQSEANAPVL